MMTTLVIMAAGIGKRFGTGIKQLAAVDSGGHIIMDYSVHDAIEAGFGKIVFVIRRDIEEEFKEVIGDRIEAVCRRRGVKVGYAFQSLEEIPGQLPQERTKPWGTGQAVLAAADLIEGPFAVINADDYYGKEPYREIHEFLCRDTDQACLMGYVLRNTLSDNGSVTRGICRVEDGYLTKIDETRGITKTETGAEASGISIPLDSEVSMNMWGFTGDFIDKLRDGFRQFFEEEVPQDPLACEYLIPIFVGKLVEEGFRVSVLHTDAGWCGMTYKEDIPPVQAEFSKMIEKGIYSEDLFSDL